MMLQRRRIVANDEIDQELPVDDTMDPETVDEGGQVAVDEEATDLLFETEDVAQLLAEATGQDVDVTVDDETNEVSFGIGENEFTVTPEGDEEILEARRMPKKTSVKANTKARTKRISPKRPVKASTRRVIRRGSAK